MSDIEANVNPAAFGRSILHRLIRGVKVKPGMVPGDVSFFPDIGVEIQGIESTMAEFVSYVKGIDDKAASLTRHYGALLAADVKARARGAFNVLDYDSSIYVRSSRGKGGASAIVGSDAPQSIRLEYGFVGRDSLGRFVEQRPRPHFRAALDDLGPKYAAAVAGLFR